jgi:hypothetical protein
MASGRTSAAWRLPSLSASARSSGRKSAQRIRDVNLRQLFGLEAEWLVVTRSTDDVSAGRRFTSHSVPRASLRFGKSGLLWGNSILWAHPGQILGDLRRRQTRCITRHIFSLSRTITSRRKRIPTSQTQSSLTSIPSCASKQPSQPSHQSPQGFSHPVTRTTPPPQHPLSLLRSMTGKPQIAQVNTKLASI